MTYRVYDLEVKAFGAVAERKLVTVTADPDEAFRVQDQLNHHGHHAWIVTVEV
jgi:hypothetical protein